MAPRCAEEEYPPGFCLLLLARAFGDLSSETSLRFWLADYGGGGYMVLLVVGVAGDVGGTEAFHHQDAPAHLYFLECGQPDFVVDVLLLEYEAASFLNAGEHAARDFCVAGKIAFEANNGVSLFVHPD